MVAKWEKKRHYGISDHLRSVDLHRLSPFMHLLNAKQEPQSVPKDTPAATLPTTISTSCRAPSWPIPRDPTNRRCTRREACIICPAARSSNTRWRVPASLSSMPGAGSLRCWASAMRTPLRARLTGLPSGPRRESPPGR